MTIFTGGFIPDTHTGLRKLWCIKQLLFCIAQEENAFRELDSYSILGLTTILEEIGFEIETHYEALPDELEPKAREGSMNITSKEAEALREILLHHDAGTLSPETPVKDRGTINSMLGKLRGCLLDLSERKVTV